MGSKGAAPAPAGPYVKPAHSDFQLWEMWNGFCWPREEETAWLPFGSPGTTGFLQPSDVVACRWSMHIHTHTQRKITSSHQMGYSTNWKVCSGVWPPFGRYWQFPLKGSQPRQKASCAADLMKMSLNSPLNSFKKWWVWLEESPGGLCWMWEYRHPLT